MSLESFWRALQRSWLPALLLLEAAIFGSLVYARRTIQSTAEATVAVRNPITARPGYQAAQITFDAVVQSRRLSERVAQRMGEDEKAVEAALSVEIIPAAEGFNVSPLYAVQGEKPDDEAALALVNTAVEEARKLYVELNDTKQEEITATLATERASLEQRKKEAEAAFSAFEVSNDTHDLSSRLQSEVMRVAELQSQVTSTSADLAATRSVGDPVTIQALEQRLGEFNRQLSTTTAERDRLRGLASQHEDLAAEVTDARAKVEQLGAIEKEMVLSQLLPLHSQVKVLDDARIRSQTLMKILVYVVGFILGLLAAATAVYGRFLTDASRETVETISDGFGAPVLAKIPAKSLRGALR